MLLYNIYNDVTLLYRGSTHHSTGLLGNGHTDSVALLVASGADINMKGQVS